jgi:hypothetical protein
MTVDELDRILGSEEPLEPSSGLSASVMDAVREEARTPEPLPFPWRRAIPGIVACLALLAVGIAVAALTDPPPGAIGGVELLEQALSNPLAGPIAWAAGSLLFSWVTVALTRRFAR